MSISGHKQRASGESEILKGTDPLNATDFPLFPTGAVVGGIVGGIVFLGGGLAAVYYMRKKEILFFKKK